MQLTPDMITALTNAARGWHHAQRQYEHVSRMFADAQNQLQLAERDLHELARAIEVTTGVTAPVALASSVVASAGSVTMPIAQPSTPAVGVPPTDGLDAGAEVLRIMQAERMGMQP